MHPPIDDLLAVRDGGAAPAVHAHLADCGECRAEVARLARVRDELRALPAVEPPPGAWHAIAARRTAARRRAWSRNAGLALAASVVMAVALTVLPTRDRSDGGAPPQAAQSDFDRLVAYSRDLDFALAAVESKSRILDLGTAHTIVSLEDRIAAVDAHLRHREGLTPDQAAALLRHRVELTQALVDVHAAQTRHSF